VNREKPIEEALNKKEFASFKDTVENLSYVIKENYPVGDVKLWLDMVCSYKKKLEEVVE
jgi:hypothetical protein